MTTTPTDRNLGQAVLALDEMLRDPRCRGLLAAIRSTAPTGLLDQLDDAAGDNHRHLTAEAALLNGTVSYPTADQTPERVTLGALHALRGARRARRRTGSTPALGRRYLRHPLPVQVACDTARLALGNQARGVWAGRVITSPATTARRTA